MSNFPNKAASQQKTRPEWGRLPHEVEQLILRREWHNSANLKARLVGDNPFPIRLGLKPPAGNDAVEDLPHFQNFVKSWQSYSSPHFVEWETRNYRALSKQRIPCFFTLNSIQELIAFVGEAAAAKSEIWQTNMAPLLDLAGDDVYRVLVKHIKTLEILSLEECHLLKSLTEQLSAGAGAGKYLRAVPLLGVDTKFMESHSAIIVDLLDTKHDGAVSRAGGLSAWLGCLENPKGWLCVRPLCEQAKKKMGGFEIMQLPSETLRHHPLPATHILVVENRQSGLALPALADTIAIFGGGKNVAWMNAPWLKKKRVAYWGDIDTWGLAILSDVRTKLPSVTPLMCDSETITMFEHRMVAESESLDNCPPQLTEAERALFFRLKSGDDKKSSRLEQERLSSDYILQKLQAWLSDSATY